MPLTQTRIMSQLSRRLPSSVQHIELVLGVDPRSNNPTDMHILLCDDSCTFMDISLYFHVDEHGEKYAYIGSAQVDPSLRGQGLGRRMVANLVNLFSSMEVDGLEVFADGEDGSHSWGRCGFDFNEDADSLSSFYEMIAERWAFLKSVIRLPANTIDQVETLLEQPYSRCIQDIAALNFNLAASPLDDYVSPKQILLRYVELLCKQQAKQEGYDDGDIKYDPLYMRETLSTLLSAQHHKLGTTLLRGLKWSGRIDFSDKRQLERVLNYCDRRETACVKHRPAMTLDQGVGVLALSS